MNRSKPQQNRLTLLALIGSAVAVAVGLVLLSYGFQSSEACVPQLPGRCSPVPGYVVELAGAVMLSISLQTPMRALLSRWHDSTSKSWVLASTGASVFAGAIVGYAVYYLSVAVGLVVANYPCGTYLSLYSCVEYDPIIPILFVFSGGSLGFTIFTVSRKVRALYTIKGLPDPQMSP